MKRKKILVTLLHPFTPRAVLYTGLLQKLMMEGHEITILVPEEKYSFYAKSSFSRGLIFKTLKILEYNINFSNQIMTFFEYAIHTNIKKFHAREMYVRDMKKTTYFMRRICINTIGKSRMLQFLLRACFSKIMSAVPTGVEHYLTKDVDILFSTDIYNVHDLLFIESARRKKIKVIGMVRSWDNNVSKFLLPLTPDHIVTQNEIQKNELKSVQGVTSTIITSIGIPYYEYYTQYTPTPRNIFMSSLGIPTESKLILFSPAGGKFIDHDWQFCQIIKDAIECGDLPNNTYVLVRCHPGNPCDLTSFQPNEHFIIERPGTIVDSVRGNKGAELDIDATNHLIDELTHSDVVINILSSIVLDAAVVETPVITPQFEGFSKNVPFLKSVQRFQEEENMAMLLNIWNGSRPKTKTAFIEEIKRILQGDIAPDTLALKRIVDNYNISPETKNELSSTQSLHNILSKD